MSGLSNVRVAVRARPLSAKEQLGGCRRIVQVVDKLNQVVVGADRGFTFDFAFDGRSTQQGIFEQCVRPLVDSAMDGYNATVFAYGQTGSGKTYTMGTCENATTEPTILGMVPRAVDYLYERIDQWKREHSNAVLLHRTRDVTGSDQESTLKVRVSFYEVHLENVRDLLQPDRLDAENVQIRSGAGGQVVISGLRLVTVKSSSHLRDLLEMGSIRRSTGSTDMNQYSSRSHAIFTVYVDQHIVHAPPSAESEDDDVSPVDPSTRNRVQAPTLLSAKFHFVDLAGSERAKKSGAKGDRFKEAVQINQGLLCLGNVISALGDKKRRQGHVPFRDSKLTRILQDSLGGNSRTLMIACISPSSSDVAETLNTLKYANRARNIRNQPIRNEHREELALQTQLDEMQRQLLLLERQRQQELEKQQTGGGQQDKAVAEAVALQLQDRDAHIADLEAKLGGLHQLSKQSTTLLQAHAQRAAQLCDDIRSTLGPMVADTNGVPAVARGEGGNPQGGGLGSGHFFGTAVVQRLQALADEAKRAAGTVATALREGNDESTHADGGTAGELIAMDSTVVADLKSELSDARAELARDEIIFASKNEEVLMLQGKVRRHLAVASEMQDEIDHLRWQLSQAQHNYVQQVPQPNGWAKSLFVDDDDDDVLMAEVDDDNSADRISAFAGPSAGASRITTSPIDFNSTFSENAGRQLRQYFDVFSSQPRDQHDDTVTEPARTPERRQVQYSTSNGSSDEKRVRQLQSRIEEQDQEIGDRQQQYEHDMQKLRTQMKLKQELIDRLTREEQLSSAALEDQERQIAKLEDDIDMYETELRRAADELGRASQTELQHQRRQTEAAQNERLLREAEAQLRKLRRQRQQQRRAGASEAISRSTGAKEELLQMKQRQVAMMRQFKTDEAARRTEAQRLKQRLAQLQKQRDRQDLEISRLRESNKKQQSVIQAKDDLLRTYKHHGSTRSPASGRRSSGGNSSFVAASPGSRRRRRGGARTSSNEANSEGTTVPQRPETALVWFRKNVRDVAAQLRAQRTVDDRLQELRAALGQQESKTAERRRLADLVQLRGRVTLDQTLGTLGRNLDALHGETEALVAKHMADKHEVSPSGMVQDLDDELDAIDVNVAHIRQEIAAAKQQVRTGQSFKMLAEQIESLPTAAANKCLRWAARTIAELQTETERKAQALGQLQSNLRQTEDTARKLQTKLVKQQTDYAAQVVRLQDELRRIRSGDKSSKNTAATASALKDIRTRMGDIRTQTMSGDPESKMINEAKQGDAADGRANSEQIIKLRRRLAKEREARQNEVRRMNRYRWEREKLRKQVAELQKEMAAQKTEVDQDRTDDVQVMTHDLQAALEDCVFYKAQNKELKRKVKELGHSLSRFSGK